jgi:tetratricopeptide (TPR) repeat protein
MIVRNEEHNLGDCLASVADLVDEVVVVDTGSTDRTRDVAQQYGGRVFEFPWVDDFSAARNCALQNATGDWIFWMDADDRLNPANRTLFQRLKDQLPDGNYAYMMKQRSPPDHELGSPLVVDHVRLFRRQPNVAWRYRLHEQILPLLKEAKAKLVVTDLVVEHLGYRESGLRRRKLDRNLRILLLEHQEQPEDAFILFNLAGTYLDLGDQEQAIPFLHQCIEKAPRGASFLPKAYVLLVQNHRTANRLDDAAQGCEIARQLFPKNPELLFEEGLLHQARNNPIAAQRSFETILRLPRGAQFVGTDEGIFGHLTRHHLAIALRDQRQLLAAEEQWRLVTEQAPHYAPGWLALVEVLLQQQRFADAEILVGRSQAAPQAPLITPVLAARLQLARKEVAAAIDTLESALAAAPGNHWVRLFLCDIMNRHGVDPGRIEKHLQQILSMDAGHREAKARLADLLKRTQATPAK